VRSSNGPAGRPIEQWKAKPVPNLTRNSRAYKGGGSVQRLYAGSNLVWQLPLTTDVQVLPVNAPAPAARGREVMAHYITSFPLRLSATGPATPGTAGYYYQNYLAPALTGESGVHARYGGFTRDYPIQDGLTSTSTTGWEQKDMEKEVRDAIAAGLTGFTLNMLGITGWDGSTPGQSWPRIKRMVAAVEAVNAAEGTSFSLMLMPDGTATSTSSVRTGNTPDINASADALAGALSKLATSPAIHRINGVMAIAPFSPEAWPKDVTGRTTAERVQFWARLRSTLQNTYGIPVLYWFCYVLDWTVYAPMFDSLAYGHGRWGDRDPVQTGSPSYQNRGAPAYCHSQYSKPWMHFGGGPMDSRPSEAGTSGVSYRTSESIGTQALELSWLAAIDGFADGDMNQITTWNDMAENSHVCPSHNQGNAMLDLQTYFLSRYRTGRWSPIVRDALYLSHRVHRTDALLSGTSADTTVARKNGSTAFTDTIDVLVFATATATVEILRDGNIIASQTVQAGRSHVTAPLPSTGTISARMLRAGTAVPGTAVASDQPVKSVIDFWDYHYRTFSSRRQSTPAPVAPNGYGAAYGASYGA
jgi:hypothetical protein